MLECTKLYQNGLKKLHLRIGNSNINNKSVDTAFICGGTITSTILLTKLVTE